MIDICLLTTYLIDTLAAKFEDEGALIGDGVAPLVGGWSEGTPNTPAGFTPYLVVKAGTTSSMGQDTPLCTTVPMRFYVPYIITSFENTRADADELAARSRDHLKTFDTTLLELGDLRFNPSHIFIDSVTGASRDDSIHPKMWSGVTNLRLNVARVSA